MAKSLLTKFGGVLYLELSEPTETLSPGLYNQHATSTAKLKTLRLVPEVWENHEFREPTEAELQSVEFTQPEMTLVAYKRRPITFKVKTGTVTELYELVLEYERQTRGESEWFGGIDVHHVYFEGLHLDDNGHYHIGWGS